METQVMTQVDALKLAQRVVEFYLTGSPTLDTFSLSEINEAQLLLDAQWSAKHQAGLKRWPHKKAFSNASAVFVWMRSRLKGYHKRKLSKWAIALLTEAQAVLPGLIERLEAAYEDYWKEFTAEAIAEFEAILEVA